MSHADLTAGVVVGAFILAMFAAVAVILYLNKKGQRID